MNSQRYRIETDVELTPKKATQWLETVKRNRDVSQHIVEIYSRQMKGGQWKSHNGSTMVFDTNGEFRDGQHRAWAVLMSGTTIKVSVAYNVEPDDVRTIDTGAHRTAADTITMEEKEGGRKIKHAGQVASALVIVAGWLEHQDIYHKVHFTNEEVYKMFCKHREIEQSVEMMCIRTNLCSASVCGAVHYILSRVDAHKALVNEFFQKFLTGENLTAKSPVLVLRNRFIQETANSKASMSRSFCISCLLKAWAAYANGIELRSITYDPESLPQPFKKIRHYKKDPVAQAA